MQVANDVSLDFADDHGPVSARHYAFLVSEREFDEIFGRIRERGLSYWADPGKKRPEHRGPTHLRCRPRRSELRAQAATRPRASCTVATP